MFITGCQVTPTFCSTFALLRGLFGPLPYILAVAYIEGIKIILVFNIALLNCCYIIHFSIIFNFTRVSQIPDEKVKLAALVVGSISILPNFLYILLVMKSLKV